MYLTQYKEICEKQGWAFETCDNGKKVRITLKTLPSEHSFTVSKDNFAEQIKAVSESYLAKEYARIGHAASTTGKPIGLASIFNEGFAVSAALDALAAALGNAKVEAQTWICTDPDTCQWRRQIGETRFELYDILEVPDGYFAVHGEVDPAEDMTPGELEQLLRSFDGLVDDTNTESERWALTAEAQFETEEFSAERGVFDTFEEAEAFIRAKVEADNATLPKQDPNNEDDELWKLDEAISARNAAVGVVKTRLDTIRSLDKLRLAIFLQDVHSHAKDYPNDNLSWCEWLSKADDGHLLDVEHVSL